MEPNRPAASSGMPDDGDSEPVLTNPWLQGDPPTKRLERADLEERILNLLSTQNMCVLATVGPDGPLATPVRYFHLDFTLVFTAKADSPKLRNIDHEPRVSIGVFAPLVGQASSRGAQLFGSAEILSAPDADFEKLMSVHRWQADAAERGRSLDRRPQGPAVKIDVEHVVYTDHWLIRSGHAPRQFWRRQ